MKEKLDGLFFGESFLFLEIGHEISLIAVLEDGVEVVGSFFNVVELDDVAVVACLQHFDFVFEELHELSCI